MADAPRANPVRNSRKNKVPRKWGISNEENALVRMVRNIAPYIVIDYFFAISLSSVAKSLFY